MAQGIISGVRDLRAGDIGFGPIPGVGGWSARVGMMLLRDDTRYPHVFVVQDGPHVGAVPIVEAAPGGARYRMLADGGTSAYCYIRPRYAQSVLFRQGQRWDVADQALAMVRRPYGWMNYPYLATKRLGIKSKLIDAYVSRETDDGRPVAPICSQLADAALSLAGVHVFKDGRKHHDVTPGDLFYGLLAMGPEAMWFPQE